MTYRELMEKLNAIPDHYLDETARINIPIGNTDDYEVELDVDFIDFAHGFVSIKAEVLWPQHYWHPM